MSLIKVFAPAKINLYLHVTDRLENGYHVLDSLVGFADIGDEIHLEPSETLSLDIAGPFAPVLAAEAVADNLVLRAAEAIGEACGRNPNVKLTLHKNLPVAAGLGGGSADAAAAIKALLQYWELSPADVPHWEELLLSLGADVPVCMAGKPVLMRGVGEEITELSSFPSLPVLLVNPLLPCSTADVFARLKLSERQNLVLPEGGTEQWVSFLAAQGNDLTTAACELVPEISDVLHEVSTVTGCQFSRMAGSGATCFGVFDDPDQAGCAAKMMSETHENWWIQHRLLQPF